MHRVTSLLAGAGLGAGLMCILDPKMGRRRRALIRDKIARVARQAGDAAEVVGRDMKNRARGLAAGDLSVLVGGKRALANPVRGGWSPTGRALMGGLGMGLFAFGLTRHAPTACILGTIGMALAAESITNAGIDDIACAAGTITEKAKGVADNLGMGESMDGRGTANAGRSRAKKSRPKRTRT